MNYTEFRTRLRQLFWVTERSDAARSAFKWGGGALSDHLYGTAKRFQREIETREKDWMAKGKQRRTGFVQNLRFVDLELSREDKDDFKKWVVTDDELISYVETRGCEGYKIGMSYKQEKGSWVASLTCVDKDSDNFECCLSAFGASWLQALRVVCFKDTVLLEGDWTRNFVTASSEDNFG